MSDNGNELRSIAWQQAFPFVRLFRTLALALDFKRLLLALICVLIVYFGGRVLDRVWIAAGAGVTVQVHGGNVASEIQSYATASHQNYREWRHNALEARQQIAVGALVEAGVADSRDDAITKLESNSLRALLIGSDHDADVDQARRLISKRLTAGLAEIDGDESLTEPGRQRRTDELVGAANTLRAVLAGTGPRMGISATQHSGALSIILGANPDVTRAQRAEDRVDLNKVITLEAQLARYLANSPKGPFISLVTFEADCFAAAIQGVCQGRLGLSGGALDPEPAMIGSIATAWRGAIWLVTQRFWYALVYGIFHLLVFAFFGGALCRSAAVQSARDEGIGVGEALGFAREKYSGLLMAPLLPVAVFAGIALLMALGGLIGAVPYLGELFTGALYPLALLGGFALAVILLATVLGFALMWPTIAVEGSDGFDALSRACNYVGSRIFHFGFYSIVLLVYGAVSFVIVRLVLLLVLKLSHTCTGLGMNVAGSAELTGVGKLNAMWNMPAWADLSLLPTVGGTKLWGSFFNGPLDGMETFGAFLLAISVFLLVGLLSAFAVSFFFSGSTQMYFLLRRDVDATDYDEIYYEQPEEEFPAANQFAEPTPPQEQEPDQPAPPPADEPAPPPPEESPGDTDDQSA